MAVTTRTLPETGPSTTLPRLPADAHRVFLDNMAALWRHDPQLAQRIDEIDDDDRPALIPTRSGAVTVAVDAPSGPTLLHSRYDPVKEAVKLIDGVEIDDKFCFIVFGFGLGYHVRELFGRLKGDAAIVAVEPSMALLSAALSCADFADMIRSGRLIILDRLDKRIVHQKLNPHNTLMMLGARFLNHPPSHRAAAEFHAAARKLITDLIAFSRMTLLTLVGNAQVTCRNIANNLPQYLSTPPINVLRDRFKGRPAIIVSAGPSLRRNVELLSEAKGKAVLCAAQTMFKPLLARGIVPDFVTSLDFHAMSKQYFSDVSDFHDVHLVAEPKVSWHVTDDFAGPVSLLRSSFAAELIGDELAARDGLKPGATVAHLAFYLAEYMGCDPIIFVGQDLAFTGHCFYMPGVETHLTWQSEMNRFNTMETKEWERIVRNRSILRTIPDVDGRDVYTDDLLFTYLEQFERDFIGAGARIIDATEGGARMRGTDVMTLQEALDAFCTEPLPGDAFDYRRTCDWNDPALLTQGRAEIEKRIEEIKDVRETCVEMLSVLHELEGLTDDPARFNRRIIRVDELRASISRAARSVRIVNAGGQLAELQRFTADRKLNASDVTGADLAKRQLVRDIRFVERFRDGANAMIDILRDALRRFDEHETDERS